MFKNQLQELAQRSCFNLPAYASTREGPDHAPRFKACVNFNGEVFQSPGYCPTLRQAEHAAAEVALNVLSTRGSKSLTARVLDETGVYKNLLQETAHKAGLNLPLYTTIRSGPGHVPVFTCTVELADMSFTGESAKTKKQAEKNAAIAAWSALKKMPSLVTKREAENQQEEQEQDQVIVTRVLSNFRQKTGGKQKDHHQRRPGNARFWRSDHHNSLKPKPWGKPLQQVPLISASQKPDALKVQHNSFVDLLPPPPPRTTSKILPLTSSVKNQGLDGKFPDDPNKLIRAALQGNDQTHFKSLFFGPSNPSNAPKRVPLSCAQMGIMGNYSMHPKGIAPAVQIRSVIPVCAAPPASSPPLKPLSLNPTPPLKEVAPSTSSAATYSNNSASLSKQLVSDLTQPKLCATTTVSATHLSSELDKLQLK